MPDMMPAEHYALPPGTTEIMIASDDIYSKTSLSQDCSVFTLFQRYFVQLVNRHYHSFSNSGLLIQIMVTTLPTEKGHNSQVVRYRSAEGSTYSIFVC